MRTMEDVFILTFLTIQIILQFSNSTHTSLPPPSSLSPHFHMHYLHYSFSLSHTQNTHCRAPWQSDVIEHYYKSFSSALLFLSHFSTSLPNRSNYIPLLSVPLSIYSTPFTFLITSHFIFSAHQVKKIELSLSPSLIFSWERLPFLWLLLYCKFRTISWLIFGIGFFLLDFLWCVWALPMWVVMRVSDVSFVYR